VKDLKQVFSDLKDAAYERGGEVSEAAVSEAIASLIKDRRFGADCTYYELWPRPCETQGVWLAWNDPNAFRELLKSGRCSQGHLLRFRDALHDTEADFALREFFGDAWVDE
jgi:hypothetical protein